MELDFLFFINSILLGVGLAMDAFSVSLADGLNGPGMKFGRTAGIAGVFAFFQGLMPALGWAVVHTGLKFFKKAGRFVPWIAAALLIFLGIRMTAAGIRCKKHGTAAADVGDCAILAQGIATSVDAFSAGFAIAAYSFPKVLVCAAVIALVTFVICALGVEIGKKIGTGLSGRASVFGGAILILIAAEILFRPL